MQWQIMSSRLYRDIFEEEYQDIIDTMQMELGDKEYLNFINSIKAGESHQGYFSITRNRAYYKVQQ